MNLVSRPYYLWDELKSWMPSLIIFPFALYWSLNRGEPTFLHGADLIIHEGGHGVFMFFGKFLHAAGGTLMQIIIPSLIAHYFLTHGYRTGLQVALLWLGENLINISVYAADAQARKLPLLGGNKVGHDWHYLLWETGLLEYDAEVGYFFFGLAILVFFIALIIPFLLRYH